MGSNLTVSELFVFSLLIDESGQNVTHNFTLLPTTWGEYDPEAAVVTYKQTADAEPKVFTILHESSN